MKYFHSHYTPEFFTLGIYNYIIKVIISYNKILCTEGFLETILGIS